MSAAESMNLRQYQMTPFGPIPPWYEGHSEDVLKREVHHRGEPLGFKVEDVLPSRRWAIDRHGDTLSDDEFKKHYEDWYFLQLAIEAKGRPITEERGLIPVPRVRSFIDKEPDHAGRLKPIGHDEHAGEFRVRQRYAHTGDTWEEHQKKKAEENEKREKERERNALAEQLAKLHAKGHLSAEQFAEQMSSLYGVPEIPTAKPSEDEPSEETAEAASPAPAPAPKPKPKIKKARCGKELKGGVHLHENRCDTCQRLKAEETSGAS